MYKALKKYFGYDSFKNGQEEIIRTVLSGRDTLALMPTGGGKSLCYQLSALLFDGLTIVVSPLIALMEDQVSALEKRGISAVFLNSSLDWDTYRLNMDLIRSGEIKLVYCAPETLLTERVQSLLAPLRVSCLTNGGTTSAPITARYPFCAQFFRRQCVWRLRQRQPPKYVPI